MNAILSNYTGQQNNNIFFAVAQMWYFFIPWYATTINMFVKKNLNTHFFHKIQLLRSNQKLLTFVNIF